MPNAMPSACLPMRNNKSKARLLTLTRHVGWTADEIWSSVELYCSLPSYSKPFRTGADSSKAAKAGHPATGICTLDLTRRFLLIVITTIRIGL